MNPSRGAPESRPWLSKWDLLPLAGGLALLTLTLSFWGRLPASVPTHFDMNGLPNSWTAKTALPWLMFGFPFGIWIFLGLIGGIAVPKDSRRAVLQMRIMAPLRGMVVLGLCLLMSLTVLIPIYGMKVFWPILSLFFTLLFVGIGLTVRKGYLHAPAEIKQNWKWGLFYLNSDDPRLWVPKYLGIGWTLNFARPVAWAVMAILVLLPLGLILLLGR